MTAPEEECVRIFPRAYLVTIWPDDLMNNPDSGSFCLYVAYRAPGRWGVFRGSPDGGASLGADGTWSFNTEDSDEWRDKYRFPLDEALGLALREAPRVRIMGMTAQECVAWHRRGCPDE